MFIGRPKLEGRNCLKWLWKCLLRESSCVTVCPIRSSRTFPYTGKLHTPQHINFCFNCLLNIHSLYHTVPLYCQKKSFWTADRLPRSTVGLQWQWFIPPASVSPYTHWVYLHASYTKLWNPVYCGTRAVTHHKCSQRGVLKLAHLSTHIFPNPLFV